MGIIKKALHSKIDVFVKFESAINLEIRGQIKKNMNVCQMEVLILYALQCSR